LAAIERGAANLTAHIDIVRGFGLPCVVAVNRFPGDTDEEVKLVQRLALERGAHDAQPNTAVAEGGQGATALARSVVAAAEQPSSLQFTYPDDVGLDEKIRRIVHRVYGGADVDFLPEARATLKRFHEAGLDRLPICMAKTHLSISHDPALRGAPSGFKVPV